MQDFLPTDKQADAALFAVELEDAVVAIVRGTGPRRRHGPIIRAKITARVVKYPMFKDVTGDQVHDAIIEMIGSDRIRCVALSLSSHRRHNGAYGYVVD